METCDSTPVVDEVLVTEDEIEERLTNLAKEIDAHYAEIGADSVLLIGVLRGSIMIMADLSRKMQTKVDMDWMAVSSYGGGTTSSGVVRILKDITADIRDRHVLIVEDIIDSGLTLSWLKANLESRGPKTLKIVTALRKPAALKKTDLEVDFVGFDVPDVFVVGYGLDYDEYYRNLPCIARMKFPEE